MEAPHDDHVVSDSPVEDTLRKLPDMCASRVAVDGPVPPRGLKLSLENLRHSVQELVAQARRLRFMPQEDLLEVSSRSRPDNEVHFE